MEIINYFNTLELYIWICYCVKDLFKVIIFSDICCSFSLEVPAQKHSGLL